jgi:NAD(P)-dependent dehydrogenase (short-subunit alcohol dehydrogenase family)
MGKTYKAVEITKPGTFRLVDKPVIGPGEEQVRIRVEACGAKMLSDRSFYESIVDRIPLGRIGTPQDVMGAVLFLVSPASDFIMGQTIYVDGGVTATQ